MHPNSSNSRDDTGKREILRLKSNTGKRFVNKSNKSREQPKRKTVIGHEKRLKEAVANSTKVAIVLARNGDELTGRLIDADKYSISILCESGIEQCFYKHSIESFYFLS